ncbi:MAG TPA: glycosyltransferase, partial [Segetibacter sp.]
MKTVVLITTGQPSVNPRIVKEADALHAAGYKVVMLYCYWIKWAYESDKKLLKNVSWSYNFIGGAPAENKVLYFFTKAKFKIYNILSSKGYYKNLIAERSQARCYDELLHAAKAIKADIYIAHNLGALSVAVKAAGKNKAASGFDFEDYHREENEGEKDTIKKKVVFLEEKYVPYLSYLSTSSPQITERVKANFSSFNKPVFTLLNCFPLAQQPEKRADNNEQTLQLFWFSQTIGKNRGLEAVVLALKELNNPDIQLTLAGNPDTEMTAFIEESAGNIKDCIHFAGIIQPGELPAFAARFDVGLATEIATPLNRNICLTNKIFTYLLAGNCILASDTKAQKDFVNSYKGIGMLYKNDDARDLAEKLKMLYNDKSLLKQCKENAYRLA